MIAAETATQRPALSPLGAVAVTLGVTGIGVAFNVYRLGARLDRADLVASLLAFTVLAAVSGGLVLSLRMSRQEAGLTLPRPAALVGVLVASTALAGMAFLTAPSLRLPALPQVLAGIVLFAVFTAPTEELLFRGVLYGVLEVRAGSFVGIVVSAVAFAVVHVPVYGVATLPLAIAAGLILGWLRWWSGSIVAPTLTHAIADLALLWL